MAPLKRRLVQDPEPQRFHAEGDWQVEIAGKRYPAVASMKPLYDPEDKQAKA